MPEVLTPPALPSAAWTGAAGTKFHVPQLRRHVVERAELLRQARQMAAECRLSLVCAPAGFGKSVLLAQLAAAERARSDIAWLSLDEDDNDANRMFASVLRALQHAPLEWAVDPQALIAQVNGIGAGSRAAVAGLINALCSYDRHERLLLFIDDLHRISDAGALRLLDDIIDRLPPEVGVVIGSRLEPELALARWRGRGELGELRMADLQFDKADAEAFAALLPGAATPALVQDALARTEGWAAGLQLMFGTGGGGLQAARAGSPNQHAARRHLFDFLAHEVLTELPEHLRSFVLDCAVLPEMTPALCSAVSGREDARAVLDALYRRHLFLTALDEAVPTLRFHDLFRDFLLTELERSKTPEHVALLHERAARAETVLPRAVAHWLKARRWDEALALMVRGAKPLLAVGSQAMLERWLEQLPPDVREARPEVAHLRGLIAWVTWDWLKVIPALEQAWAGYEKLGTQNTHATILTLLAGCYNSMGDAATAIERLERVNPRELDPATRLPFSTMRGWLALSQGHVNEIVPWLHACADDLAHAPSALYPDIYDIVNGHFAGVPAATAPMRRMQATARAMRQQEAAQHWSTAVVAQGAWLEFWQGQRAAAERALEAQRELQQHMPGALALILSTHQLAAFHAAAGGRHAEAQAEARAMLKLLAAPHAASLEASWGHGYMHVLARVLWIAQDEQALAALPPLFAERAAQVWPPYGLGHLLVSGQLALLRGDLAQADTLLSQAAAQQDSSGFRLPGFMGDARPALAMLRQRQGDTEAARRVMASVIVEAMEDEAIGLLLLEPPHLLAPLLTPFAREPGMSKLLEHLADWHETPPEEVAAAASPTEALSQREQEVLALLSEGLSNKLIARRLDLSLHTVKRHVANILAKLDAGSRAAAVARARQSSTMS